MWIYIRALQSLYAFSIMLAVFMCGICAAYNGSFLATGIAVGLTSIAIVLHYTYGKTPIASISLFFFLVGYGRCYWQKYTYTHVTRLLQATKPTSVYAKVIDLKKAEHKRYKAVMLCAVDATDTADTWHLQCYCAQYPMCHVGDTIHLQQLHPTIPHAQDFGLFLLKEDIHATAFIRNEQIHIIEQLSWSRTHYLHTLRQQIADRLRTKCSPITFALIMLIFFGDRLQVKQEYHVNKDLFNGWGIMHFLARSGLHLVIFILTLSYCLSYVPIAYTYKQLVLMIMCAIYYFLSWPTISFIRAFVTLLCYTLCNLCNLQTDPARIILVVTFACLLHNPMILFFLDFQLSFGLTAVLATTSRYLITRSTA